MECISRKRKKESLFNFFFILKRTEKSISISNPSRNGGGCASCKKCGESIPNDSLQMAIMVQSPMFDGKVPHWYHFSCLWKVGHSIRQPGIEVDGFSELRWDDQQKVKKAAEAGGVTGKGQDGIGSKAEETLGDFAAE